MKYQSEYQRNYQNRPLKKYHELSVEERKLSEVPMKRSSSSPSHRYYRRSWPSSSTRYKNGDDNLVVIGPNDKFSHSYLYRMKQPIKDYPRVAKSQEYALLGKNEKFENNIIYPLRRPVLSDSPRVVVRRRRKENHSCGIQTELNKATSFYDPRYRRKAASNRKRTEAQSEYQRSYNWKQPSRAPDSGQIFIDDVRSHDRCLDQKVPSSVVRSPTKNSVGVNTPARVEIDVSTDKPQVNRPVVDSTKPFRLARHEIGKYRTGHKHTVDQKQSRTWKAHEAEDIEERKRREIPKFEHPPTDEEDINRNVDLGNEFRQKYPHGKLRRWKSEYQATYKPFWRFDYKNGKWYKDTAVNETGFNPNLFWYKELMATRQRADEYRANAEADHLSRDHTLQLPTSLNGNNNDRAWDVDADNDNSDSVISVDRDLERERAECQLRREKDAKRQENERIQSKLRYQKQKPTERPLILKTDQVSQTDHPMDRIIYIDEPPPEQPSIATKAFLRNLGSSSVQQHMSWDSDSLCTQRTNSDIGDKLITSRDLHRRHCTCGNSTNEDKLVGKASPRKYEIRGTTVDSTVPVERQPNNLKCDCTSSQRIPQNDSNIMATRPVTTYQESQNATGRPSYDSNFVNRRPYTSMDEYCSYPATRFKDEVTEYYYGRDDNRQQRRYTPPSKNSFQNHLQTLNNCYGRTNHTHNKDDDVLSVNSAHSLTSSCSLASQTLERAQHNMNKYWGDH